MKLSENNLTTLQKRARIKVQSRSLCLIHSFVNSIIIYVTGIACGYMHSYLFESSYL